MAECNVDRLKKTCSCTYMSCSRRGKCCACVEYHNSLRELPGCFFPPAVEREYDRSRACYISAFGGK